LVKPDGAGTCEGLPSQTSFEAITAPLTANTLTVITKRWLADEIARANASARFDANLQRAFSDFISELERSYRQPAHDAADTRLQHALLATARFLKRMGPDYLAPFADQFANLHRR
jgi:hypothetical protein